MSPIHEFQLSRRYFSTTPDKLLSREAAAKAPSVTLYHYSICPYCCKAKAVLNYLGVPFKQVEVDPVNKKQIKFSSEYKKVPIAVVDGQQVNESTEIIDHVLQRLNAQELLTDSQLRQLREGKRGKDQVTEWATFSDKKLGVLMYPNLCASLASAYTAFNYVHQVAEWSLTRKMFLQILGSVAMTMGSSRLKKKYNIIDEKQDLKDVVAEWTNNLGTDEGSLFHGGSKPDLADLCIYGVLSAVRHMPLHVELMESNSSLAPWYTAMEKLVDTQN